MTYNKAFAQASCKVTRKNLTSLERNKKKKHENPVRVAGQKRNGEEGPPNLKGKSRS